MDLDKLLAAFRGNGALSWAEHHQRMFHGVEKFFRPGYQAHLTSSWLPALEGVVDKLQNGAKVADVGCGHGASTIVMAKAYPRSRFFGFDFHAPSIEVAVKRAAEAESAPVSRSRPPPPRAMPSARSTSSASSIACTILAIPSGRPARHDKR